MKQIAILDYLIMFDPSESWSSGSQFEAQLGDFFLAYGFEAQIVEPKGNSGKRVIYLNKVQQIEMPKQDVKPSVDVKSQVKKLQGQIAPKVGQPQGQQPFNKLQKKTVPTLQFQRPGYTNRQKVRI